MWRSELTLGLLVALCGCKTPATPRAAPVDRVADLIREVAYIRRLPAAEIAVEVLRPMDWSSAIHSSPQSLASRERLRAWLSAFSLTPLAGDDVMNEQALGDIAAYYDEETKKIVMPRAVGAEHRSELAHEVAHALVDRAFGIARVKTAQDEDRYSAVTAFIEGDAGVVEHAWESTRKTLYSPSAIIAELARRSAAAPEDKSFPGVARHELEFTYDEGFRFVAALHRTGGFALVDRAWARPPWTTEQVFHPKKYLAGENAVPVAFAAAHPGQEVAVSGRMGELGIRTVVRACLEGQDASLSAGWGGDEYRVLRRPDGRLVLEWAIAWDDEAAAMRFVEAKEALLACWARVVAREEATSAKPRLGEGVVFVRRGSTVAIVRGAGDASAPLVEDCFAAVAARVPDSPPLGAVKLVEEGEPLVEPKARLVGRRFDFSPFGFAFDVPPDLSARMPTSLSLFVSDANDYFGFAIDVLSIDRVDSEIDRWVELREKRWEGRAVAEGSGEIETPLGDGWERRWTMGPARMRSVAIPICGGMRAIVLTAAFGGHISFARYEMVLGALSRLGEDPPRGCR